MQKTSLFLFLFYWLPLHLVAQTNSVDSIEFSLQLDNLVIEATRTGFNVKDFVRMVQKDETFYLAFHGIRFMDYQSDNQIVMYDKKGNRQADYHLVMQQKSNGECRTMTKIKEESTGDFIKNNSFNYYTAKIFDKAFLTHGTVCDEERKAFEEEKKAKGIEKHINELKKLVFKPGQKADVPLIGNKMAIFSPEMQPFYNYSIQSKVFESKTDCYVFVVEAKPEYQGKKKGETVVKYLETYFDKNNLQVLARKYQLQYQSLAFDFDVTMFLKLQKFGKKYVPSYLQYDGNWDVPLHARERGKFVASFWNFD